MSKIRKEDITESQWNDYRKVQDVGRYNMLDPRAQRLSRLSRDVYLSIIENYDWLSGKFEGSIYAPESN